MAADRSRPAASRSGPKRSAGPSLDRERVAAVLRPVVRAARLELEDLEVRSAGRRRVVRVLVDGEDGISLDQVADVSRAVSTALDDSDVLGEAPYTLEVSSPGVDRPLTLPRHWRRNVGRLVLLTPVMGAPTTGRIAAVDEDGVEVDLEQGRRRIEYAALARAVVQVEFRPSGDAAADPDGHDGDEPDATEA